MAALDARRLRRSRPTWSSTRHKALLRFITCGSVDDGKSTLIGRLLHDTKLLLRRPAGGAGKRQSPPRHPGRRASTSRCWSMAWRPSASRASPSTWPTAIFGTDKRKFIVADCPGPRAVHPQHGHRRIHRRPGRGAGRCAQGPADADPPAQLHRRRCWASATWCWRSTRWTWSTTTRRVRRHRRGLPRAWPGSWASPARHRDPAVGAEGRQRAGAVRRRCPGTRGPSLLRHLETVPMAARDTATSASACRCSGSTGRTRISAASPAPLAAGDVAPGDDIVVLPSGSARSRSRASSPPTAICRAPAPGRRSR